MTTPIQELIGKAEEEFENWLFRMDMVDNRSKTICDWWLRKLEQAYKQGVRDYKEMSEKEPFYKVAKHFKL